MKKIILILLAITSFLCNGQSRNNLIFKVGFKPETNYNQTTKQTDETTIQYIGSEEFLKKIKDKGIQNPTITTKSSTTESVYKTGKIENGSSFPLTIEFLKTTNSDGKITIPDGTIIYGHELIGKTPVLDSIRADGVDQKFKEVFLQTMQTTISQLTFDERNIKVGDYFTIESPLSIPINGIKLDMTIRTNYRLLSIKNNVGDFNITQYYTMESTSDNPNDNPKIDATGMGTGKLFYDVVNNYNLKYQIDSHMRMKMILDKFQCELNTKSQIIQIAEMSKN